MSEKNTSQEVVSEEKKSEIFQQNELGVTEEPVTLWSGKELAAFLETTFPMTEQEADLLVGYMEGHNYNLGHKDGVLYRGDLCFEEGKVKWEPDTIDDVVDAVSEWNFEMMQTAKADMENTGDALDYSKKKSYFEKMCEDEKVLDVLFDRTKYGKDLNEMAQKLAEEFICDLNSEEGLDGAIGRMKEEVQKAAQVKEKAQNESDVFEYQGYHFRPAGKLEKAEDFFQITARLRRDVELGIMQDNYGGQKKHDYSRESFYAASTDKEADVFLCLENGKEYAPCEHELQEYRREIPAQKKGRTRSGTGFVKK